jgi:predicted RNA-binding Zn-ribbon protein involved in translation (DUF1610 family)
VEVTDVTRIRASCPECGEVDLRPDAVTLHLVRAADGEVANGSSYRFLCPDCAAMVTKPADGRIAQLLLTGGVPIEESEEVGGIATALSIAARDPRPPHPEAPPPGPALTLDDLLDLHLALRDDAWLDALLDR